MEVVQHDSRGEGFASNSDCISLLPVELIENILVRLPIKEAIRTSILSSTWKNKWASMPDLVFEEESLGCKLPKYVDMVLSVHQGPILTFQVDSWSTCDDEEVERWVTILSQNGIKDLRLIFGEGLCKIPSRLFSCHKLEHQELKKCSLSALQCFQGFKFLRTLKICGVIGVTVEKFVSSSPLLETFEMYNFFSGSCLVIRAANLRKLRLYGLFDSISLETPNLISLGILFKPNYPMNGGWANNLWRVLGRLPNIQELELKISNIVIAGNSDWFQYLSLGHTPKKLPVTCHCLNKIIMQLRNAPIEGIDVALCIVRCAPNLKTLDIRLPRQNIWEDQRITTEISFKHLEVVKVLQCIDASSVIGFAKFLLSTAPILEQLIINNYKYSIHFEDNDLAFRTKLASLPRLSAKAMILFDENL